MEGVKIKIFFSGRFSGVLARRSTPGPLKTGSAQKVVQNSHKISPETNSKAISLWARGGYVLGRTHIGFFDRPEVVDFGGLGGPGGL